jgi:hypothetical protein
VGVERAERDQLSYAQGTNGPGSVVPWGLLMLVLLGAPPAPRSAFQREAERAQLDPNLVSLVQHV